LGLRFLEVISMHVPPAPSQTNEEESLPMLDEVAAPPPVSWTARVVAIVLVATAAVAIGGGVGARLIDEQERTGAREAAMADQLARQAAPSEVQVVSPVPTEFDPNFSITGTLDPVQETEIGFNAGGRLISVNVRLGEHVREGQILGTLDRRSVSAQSELAFAAVQASEAQLELARDRMQRAERLHAAGATSEAELLAARQQFSLAQAQVSQASAQGKLTASDGANHVVKAPFSGTVTRVPDGTGMVVMPGQALFRIEDLSSLVLRSGITERALARVEVGDAVVIENPPARGVVRAFARSLDPVTRRAPIEIAIENAEGSLVGHALVKGRIVTGRTVPALRVPATAIRADRTVLVVDPEGAIEVRPVEPFFESDGTAVILGGLAASDRVVTRPSPELTPGRLVNATTVVAEKR
jgi:membrane fusion protein, multidrug efflux system